MNLDFAEVDGTAILSSLTATGAVQAVSVNIGGELYLQGASFSKDSWAWNLILDRADIKGSAFASSVTVTGAIRAVGATIGGELNLSGATFDAVDLKSADIKADAVLHKVTAGAVLAIGAHIGGRLELNGAVLDRGGSRHNPVNVVRRTARWTRPKHSADQGEH